MSRSNRLFALFALALTTSALGVAGGTTLRSAYAQEEEVVIGDPGGCEEDECNDGTNCIQNPGRRTKCDVTGPGRCATDAC
ncbi:MAG TPA: hypothetical protein VFQ45_00710 [Longimicrobium sp.]|nr:hypothetical protein [Longimicrobium sp.]